MDLTIDTRTKTIAKVAKRANSVSRHRRAVRHAIQPLSCIFPVLNTSGGELVAVGTPFACVDLTAFGRVATIDRKRRGGGEKRAVERRSGDRSLTRRSRRLGAPQ